MRDMPHFLISASKKWVVPVSLFADFFIAVTVEIFFTAMTKSL